MERFFISLLSPFIFNIIMIKVIAALANIIQGTTNDIFIKYKINATIFKNKYTLETYPRYLL